VSLGFVSLTSWLLPVLCNRRVPLCGFAVARFDSFSLADPDAVTWSQGQVRGPRSLPLTLGNF